MNHPQNLIHRIESALGAPAFRFVLALLASALLMLVWDLRCYRNFATEEAMDSAQLGRNLAEGKGYTSSYLRPLSLCLLTRRSQEKSGASTPEAATRYAGMQEPHPDIANPPVYPLALAGLMKVLPFDYVVSTTKPFWSSNGFSLRYQPDFLIALFNQALFLAIVLLAFLWARRLFDGVVAWTSAVLLLGAEVLWRFSVSGLSTMLLLLIFMGVVWCLTLLENRMGETNGSRKSVFALAIAVGALVALGGLTRYAFAWLIIPVLVYLILFADARRPVLVLLTLASFAAVFTPWILRNYEVSGTPLGTATYAVLEETDDYPGDLLERSLNPTITTYLPAVGNKLSGNLRQMLQNDVFKLGGGSLVAAFFLAGLMVGFRNRAVRRMRYFLLMTLGMLVIAQALGRTRLSVDSPEINSENLLVLLAPLVVIYGTSLFLLLLDQLKLAGREVRYAVIVLFCGVSCLPLIFTLLLPKTNPVAYPPYRPQTIQRIAACLKEDELMMSDVPWAVAWYGRRQCLSLTLNAHTDPQMPRSPETFAALSGHPRTIHAVYLTPRTTDGRFLGDWRAAGDFGWGIFFLEIMAKGAPPPDFLLREMPDGLLPEQVFLCDRKRW